MFILCKLPFSYIMVSIFIQLNTWHDVTLNWLDLYDLVFLFLSLDLLDFVCYFVNFEIYLFSVHAIRLLYSFSVNEHQTFYKIQRQMPMKFINWRIIICFWYVQLIKFPLRMNWMFWDCYVVGIPLVIRGFHFLFDWLIHVFLHAKYLIFGQLMIVSVEWDE